jgi:GNAT superfamily N-acetyltransferase
VLSNPALEPTGRRTVRHGRAARAAGRLTPGRQTAKTESMQLRIRQAKPKDCGELTRIAHAAKRFWGYPETLIRLWKPDLTITPEFVVHHPVYCAVRKSSVVGFYALSGEHAARELEHMWVEPGHIGAGVGRFMFVHLVRHLRRAGVTRLAIAADPNAEGFYRKLGARRVGRVPSRPAGRRLPLLVVRLRPSRRSNPRLERTGAQTARHVRPHRVRGQSWITS